MATRHGTVLVFKPGVTKEEAAVALLTIADLLETPETSHESVPTGEVEEIGFGGKVIHKPIHRWQERPFEIIDLVRDFDDDMGGPVWYIP